MFDVCGREPLIEVAIELEKRALTDEYFTSKKLYPNVDCELTARVTVSTMTGEKLNLRVIVSQSTPDSFTKVTCDGELSN